LIQFFGTQGSERGVTPAVLKRYYGALNDVIVQAGTGHTFDNL